LGEKFDIEFVIIGIIFLLAGGAIIYVGMKTYKVNEERTGFKYNSIGGAILLFILAIYLLYNEIIKII
jgi:hypothetical protein